MARPAKPKGQSRDKLMQIRLQGKEYETFKEAAESAGLELSSWVRERLLDAVRRDSRVRRQYK